MKTRLLISVLLVTQSAFLPSSALASDPAPSIAVIDTGTNPSLFKDSIAYEVCLLTSSWKCPNGKPTMEGAGASALPATKNKDMSHGTEMISLILRFNPAAKIIPIRIVGMTPAGNPGLYSLDDVQNAITWIVANRVKYNIAVVMLAQGKIFPNCKVPSGMTESIASLKAANVPLIAAVGNNGNRTAVFSPACLPDTVSIGATDNPWPGVQPIEYDKNAIPYIARYSNGATGQTDFFLNGRWNVTKLDGTQRFQVGTSNSTAVMSALWLQNRKATFNDTFDYFVGQSMTIKNEFISGRFLAVP
jgi:hypothetical protein